MKSKFQSYDLKDCEEFEGVVEIEHVLGESEDATVEEFHQAVQERF